MRRRDFILASAGVAGTFGSLRTFGAAPCPPATLSVDGGTSVSTTCVTTGGGDYTTNFDLTENPISESGRWAQQGGLTGLRWTNVRTRNGLAFGTQTGFGGYDDSIALLSGFTANQRLSGVIHFAGSRSGNTETHEVELILRGNYSANVQQLYECNLGYSGSSGWYAQIMRMNGPLGSFTEVGTAQGSISDVRNGDVFMAEVVGNRIRSYLNGRLLSEATDSTYASGQPGVGFFWRGTENIDDFAFTSITASNI